MQKIFFLSSSNKSSKTDDTFSQKKCLSWFRNYVSVDDQDVIGECTFDNECFVMCRQFLMKINTGPEGIEKLCQDMGVNPENIAMLVIAWKMNARRMGYFTQQEWLKGFSDLQ